MSIYKHEHTDGRGNWFLYLWARLFGLRCMSYVIKPSNPHFWNQTRGYDVADARCSKHRWHTGKHRDAAQKTGWAYGDDFGN